MSALFHTEPGSAFSLSGQGRKEVAASIMAAGRPNTCRNGLSPGARWQPDRQGYGWLSRPTRRTVPGHRRCGCSRGS